jgi:hypothetical protein
MITAEQQVVAVIDPATEFTVEIRPAPSSGGWTGFIQRYSMAGIGQMEGGGQAG